MLKKPADAEQGISCTIKNLLMLAYYWFDFTLWKEAELFDIEIVLLFDRELTPVTYSVALGTNIHLDNISVVPHDIFFQNLSR